MKAAAMDPRPAAVPGQGDRVSAEVFASFLPTPVLLSSAEQGWKRITLQRVQYPPSTVNLPAASDHRLALHLGGPTLIEGRLGPAERRWSDSGHASLIPAGVPKIRDLKGRPDFLLIHVASALVEDVITEVHDLDSASVTLIDTLAMPDESLDRLGRLLLAEAEAGALGGRLAAELLAQAFALHILRRYSSLAATAPAAPGAMSNGRLRRVVEHMRENLADPLPLTHLAAVGGTSPSRFAREFREATGEPPHRYLIGLRIRHARSLLEQTTLPVIDVGLSCGFDQPNHFATMFRKVVGMSPRAYRKARRM